MKKQIKNNIYKLFVGLLIISTLLLMNFLYKSSRNLNPLNEMNYYQLSDNLIGDVEKDFISQENSEEILRNFYLRLEKMDEIYCQIHDQPIYIDNFKGNEIFYDGYENGVDPSEYGDNIQIKSIQINHQSYDYYNLFEYIIGELFIENDFLYNGEYIPVFLGYDYNRYYGLGEEIESNYLTADFTLRIIGFLEQDTSILNLKNNGEINLNRYIILPSLHFEETFAVNSPTSFSFEEMHYLNLINGLIISDKPFVEIESNIEQITNEVNFPMPTIIHHK